MAWKWKWPWDSAVEESSNTTQSIFDNISDSINHAGDYISGSFTALGTKISEVIGESATSIITSLLDNTMVVVCVAIGGVVLIAAFAARLLDGKNVELHYTSRSNRRRHRK